MHCVVFVLSLRTHMIASRACALGRRSKTRVQALFNDMVRCIATIRLPEQRLYFYAFVHFTFPSILYSPMRNNFSSPMMPLMIGESLDYIFFSFLILFNRSLRPHLNNIFTDFRLTESTMQISVFASVESRTSRMNSQVPGVLGTDLTIQDIKCHL